MPLTNNVIQMLNEITTSVTNKNSLDTNDEEQIKNVFKKILKKGETYDVSEIEAWFSNEGTWKNKKSIIRITNMSHYIQKRFEQDNKFRILSTDESCNCS